MNKKVFLFLKAVCILLFIFSFNVSAANSVGTADALKKTSCPVCEYTTGDKLDVIVLQKSLKHYDIMFNCPNCKVELLMAADSNFGGSYNNIQVKAGDIRTKQDVLDEIETENNTVTEPESDISQSVTEPNINHDEFPVNSTNSPKNDMSFDVEAPHVREDIDTESTGTSSSVDETAAVPSGKTAETGDASAPSDSVTNDANPKTGVSAITGLAVITASFITAVSLRKKRKP